MEKNIFRGVAESSPYHLSVGAVLVNEKDEVATHYFKEFETFEKVKLSDFYLLMRETVEPGESIEGAVLRGIKEEFGATGEIEGFLGTLLTRFPRGSTWIEKTTIYFLVNLRNFDLNLQTEDGETRVSQVQWQSMDFLIEKMKEQGAKYERTDLDESIILERAKKFIESRQ